MDKEGFEERLRRVTEELIVVQHESTNKLGLREFEVGSIGKGPMGTHKVILTQRTPAQLICDCPDCEYRGGSCKHIIATAGWIATQDSKVTRMWRAFFFPEEARHIYLMHKCFQAKVWHWVLNGFWVVSWTAPTPSGKADIEELFGPEET